MSESPTRETNNKLITFMNDQKPTAILRSLSCALALVLCFFAHSTLAVKQQGMRESVLKKLTEIQEIFGEEKYQETLELTAKLKDDDLREYEYAQVLNIEAYTYINLDNTQRARELFDEILSLEATPDGLRQNIYGVLAQILMMDEKYTEALDIVSKLIEMSLTPQANHFVLKGQALYYLERHREALVEIDRALDMAKSLGQNPRENWLLIKNAVLFELDEIGKMVDVARLLLALYPKDRYLTNLAALYSQLEMPEKQLALLEPLYEQGRLEREYHLINLANLYLSLGTPYKAGKLLAQSMKNGKLEDSFANLELEAKAWQLAAQRERAIDAYQKAFEHSENGDVMVQVAYMHIARRRWELAEDALRQAIKKGELSQAGNAYLMQGMVRFYQKHFDDARRSFIQAAKFDTTQVHAEQWLKYLDTEVEKRKELETASSTS